MAAPSAVEKHSREKVPRAGSLRTELGSGTAAALVGKAGGDPSGPSCCGRAPRLQRGHGGLDPARPRHGLPRNGLGTARTARLQRLQPRRGLCIPERRTRLGLWVLGAGSSQPQTR